MEQVPKRKTRTIKNPTANGGVATPVKVPPKRAATAARVEVRRRLEGRRRLEQMLKNPACDANVLSAVWHVPMSEIARAEGIAPSIGESVFAIHRGQQFERALLKDDATELHRALVAVGVLPEHAVRQFRDLRVGISPGVKNADAAIEATRELLCEVAAGVDGVWLIAAPALVLQTTGIGEVLLIIDVLIVDATGVRPRLAVAEIKSYADCGGHTDSASLATLRLQAGLYWHALADTLRQLGLGDAVELDRHGVFVLAKPGGNRPSVRANEDLTYMAHRAARALDQLSHHAAPVANSSVDSAAAIDAVQQAPTHFCDACLVFCDRMPICHARAFDAGSGAILGDDVQRLLGDIPLVRATQLMRGAKPASDTERRLADILGKNAIFIRTPNAKAMP